MIGSWGLEGGSYSLQLAIIVSVTVAVTAVVTYAIALLIDRNADM
jgi:hypothetical protein